MNPITIEAYDNQGNKIFSYSANSGSSVRQLLETAFDEAQSETTPDPFLYTLEFYGYSQSAANPGYLGYELESINGLVSDLTHYWSLAVNQVPSNFGIDTTFPNPGSTVTFTYTPVTVHGPGSRQEAIQERRAARTSAKE